METDTKTEQTASTEVVTDSNQPAGEVGGISIGNIVAGKGKDFKGRDFELPEDAAKKLGVNKDYSEREEESEEAEKTGEGTPEKATTDEPEKKTEEAGKETPTGQPKAGEEQPLTEQQQRVAKLLESFDTTEELEVLEKGLQNHANFSATNTQRAQVLAETEKKLKSISDRIGAKEVGESIEAISKLDPDDFKRFLESADEWYDNENHDPAKNPWRPLISALQKAVPEARALSAEQQALDEQRTDLAIQKEAIGLQALKDSPFDYLTYQEDGQPPAELIKTAEVAEQYGTNLMGAHKIRLGEQLGTVVKDQTARIETLTKELEAVKKELTQVKAGGLKKPKAVKEGEQPFQPKIIRAVNKHDKDEHKPGDFEDTEAKLRDRIIH